MNLQMDAQALMAPRMTMPGDMDLPRPRFAVGTRVRLPKYERDSVIGMCYRDARRKLVEDYRAYIARQRANGLTDEALQLAVSECKQDIRFTLAIMRHADSIEIAGHAPQSMNVVGVVGTPAFLRDNKLSSDVEFNVYLLFRHKLKDGTEVAYIYPDALVSESLLTADRRRGSK